MKITFTLNGQARCLDAAPDQRVVDLLRSDFRLTGTKESCGSGECGACGILVDGESRLSCLMVAAQLQDRHVTTIEGIAADPAMTPLLRSFVRQGAVQCGYCSPGMVISALDLLRRNPRPQRPDIRVALGGNLCRCTGYQKIVDAVAAAAETAFPVAAGAAASSDPSSTQGRVPAERTSFSTSHTSKTQVLLPETCNELLKLTDSLDGAHVLAGGTDLLVLRRERRLTPHALIGLERVPELRAISLAGDEIVIGAATTFAQIASAPLVRQHLDLLAQAIDVLGSPPIRHMATLGGNLCTASPAADSLPPLYVLGANVEIRSLHRQRTVPLAEFIDGPRQNTLEPGEVLWSVRIPLPAPGTRSAFFKVGRRKALAIAVASLAGAWTLEPDGAIQHIRLAWGSVGPTVMAFPEIEQALERRRLSAELLRSLGTRVAALVRPIDDSRATASYRRQIAGNLLLKLVQD